MRRSFNSDGGPDPRGSGAANAILLDSKCSVTNWLKLLNKKEDDLIQTRTVHRKNSVPAGSHRFRVNFTGFHQQQLTLEGQLIGGRSPPLFSNSLVKIGIFKALPWGCSIWRTFRLCLGSQNFSHEHFGGVKEIVGSLGLEKFISKNWLRTARMHCHHPERCEPQVASSSLGLLGTRHHWSGLQPKLAMLLSPVLPKQVTTLAIFGPRWINVFFAAKKDVQYLYGVRVEDRFSSRFPGNLPAKKQARVDTNWIGPREIWLAGRPMRDPKSPSFSANACGKAKAWHTASRCEFRNKS